jgi:ribonuclease-3
VYLDGGIEQATSFIARQFTPLIPLIPLINDAGTPAAAMFRDFKSALQERVQSAGDPPPEYAVIGETGPDHHKVFQVEVRVGGRAVAHASGRSKKEAEQEAARLALERLPSQI